MEVYVLNDETFTKISTVDGKEKTRTWNCSNICCTSKISIKQLVIQSKVSMKAVDFLEKWCKVDEIHVTLPLNCPKTAIRHLEIITKNIVFFKSKETVENFTIPITGFIQFLNLPAIKIQFAVDEASVNAILKQWSRRERASFKGFYATRRGKMDKLDVLMDGFQEFSSEVKYSSMGTFFDISIPKVGCLAVSYTSMCFVIETAKPSVDPDFCPFVNLGRDIELAILKQLSLRDYLNLAFTCKKWYQTASTAPESIKPQLTCARVVFTPEGFLAWDELKDGKRVMKWQVGTGFQLVKQVKCTAMYIEGWVDDNMKKIMTETCRYLVKNSKNYKITALHFKLPCFFEEDTDLLMKTYNLSTNLFIDCWPELTINLPQWPCEKQKLFYSNFILIEKCFSHEIIRNQIHVDIKTCNKVFKQWIRGERPNMNIFHCFVNNVKGNPLKQILHGVNVGNFDKKQLNKVERFGSVTFDLPHMFKIVLIYQDDQIIMQRE